MLSLARVLTCIRDGALWPDDSRSGRWRASPPLLNKKTIPDRILMSMLNETAEKAEDAEEDSDGFGDDPVPAIEFNDVESPDTSDSGSDQSSDDSDEDGALAAAELLEASEQESADKRLLVKGIDDGSKAEFPDHGIVLNLVTNVAHRAKQDGKCACGAKVSDLSSEFHYLQSDLQGRSLCWRSGCAPWRASATESPTDVGE